MFQGLGSFKQGWLLLYHLSARFFEELFKIGAIFHKPFFSRKRVHSNQYGYFL